MIEQGKLWDGRPQHPERDGFHFLDVAGDTIVAQWWAEDVCWTWGNRTWTPLVAASASWHYLGPCLTPAEVAAREAKQDQMREEADCAKATLAAWFDLAKKAEAAGTEIIRASINTWLRTSLNGGMPSEHAEIVRTVVDEAARLYLWRALVPVLRTIQDEQRDEIQKKWAALMAALWIPETSDVGDAIKRVNDLTHSWQHEAGAEISAREAAAERRGIERVAAWIEAQRNDVPMTGREAAAAIRMALVEADTSTQHTSTETS